MCEHILSMHFFFSLVFAVLLFKKVAGEDVEGGLGKTASMSNLLQLTIRISELIAQMEVCDLEHS